MDNLGRFYSSRASKMRKSVIRELLKVTQDPEIISFAGGLPNPRSFPIDDLEGVILDVLRKHGRTALQYGTTQGLSDLRKAISERVQKEGMKATEENIIICISSVF